jgi:predicted alpha/beta-hydrolase family hydrolase
VPALLVTGDRDAIAPPDAVRTYGVDGVQVHVVAGADHGWWPGLDALTDAIRVFAGGLPSP